MAADPSSGGLPYPGLLPLVDPVHASTPSGLPTSWIPGVVSEAKVVPCIVYVAFLSFLNLIVVIYSEI